MKAGSLWVVRYPLLYCKYGQPTCLNTVSPVWSALTSAPSLHAAMGSLGTRAVPFCHLGRSLKHAGGKDALQTVTEATARAIEGVLARSDLRVHT